MRLDLRALLLCAVFGGSVLTPRPAAASTQPTEGAAPISVVVPEAGDLRLLAFWVALGAGYFGDEGLNFQIVVPEKPSTAEGIFQTGAAPIAVLPGPSYERLVAARFPFVVVANLLANDPLDLVVRSDLAARIKLSAGMSLRRRLDLLQGVAIGVTPQARPRLNLLFRSQGLDANSAKIVVLRGEEQMSALASHQVDALYTQTPYLEKALLDGDTVMAIDQARGDVPVFGERMIEAITVSRAFADAHAPSLPAIARAVAKAEHLLHFDRPAAVDAALRGIPDADRKHLTYLVSLYAAAVPATPHVEARLIEREATFYPVGGEPLKLAGIELGEFVFDDGGPPGVGVGISVNLGAGHAPQGSGDGDGGSSPRRVLLLAGALALAIALAAVLAEQRDRSSGVS